jgi:hypothetical protein
MSSVVGVRGRRGEVSSVGHSMLEAAVQDADEPVRERTERTAVGLASSRLGVAVAALSRRCAQTGEEGPAVARVVETCGADEPGEHDPTRAEAFVIGEVPA